MYTPKPFESFTETGARELARRVTRYWASMGYYPRVTVEVVSRQKIRGKETLLYGVRSDMVNGVPTGPRIDRVAA
jgi:hypothetical protein